MKNNQFFQSDKFSNIELHLLRSYLRAKKMRNVPEPDMNKVWDNYIKVKNLIEGSKK